MSKVKKLLLSSAYMLWVDGIFMLALAVCIGLNAYWYFEDAIYHEHTPDGQFQSVRAGEALILTRHVCSDKVIPMSAKRVFIRDDGYTAPSESVNIDSGLCGDVNFPVYIPSHLPVGQYIYTVQLTYELNPLKRVVQNLTPIPFEVIE